MGHQPRIAQLVHELRNALGTLSTAFAIIEAHREDPQLLTEALEIGTHQIGRITQLLVAFLESAPPGL